MDLKFHVLHKPEWWTLTWEDEQDRRFRDLTGQWLWNAVEHKLASLGGIVYLRRVDGKAVMEVEDLPYDDAYLTFEQVTKPNDYDPWSE